MLRENIKTLRKAKGVSQEELACRLNVVRQTISKWERGQSVPDAEMLVALSDVFEVPVSTLLGDAAPVESEETGDDIATLAERLETINERLAGAQATRRRVLRWSLIAACGLIIVVFAALALLGSPYLNWDFSDPEWAVVGTMYHGFEWVFVRVAPVLFIGALVGVILTTKRA